MAYDYLNITPQNLKGFLIENLQKSKVFTDQIYEGSNISALIDLHAAFTNLSLYYLNQTSNQGQFSETEIYENINRIVKILDYKPLGYQTALMNFRLYAQNISSGIYNIPRFSYVESSGIRYSLNEDITIFKQEDSILEEFEEIKNNKLLFQGSFEEYPLLSANGDPSEKILLTVEDTIIIDHFNIFVFVKSGTVWREYTKVETLLFEKDDAEKFEIRLNENLLYEITFGDGIHGKKLAAGDSIAIYYLKTNGKSGELAKDYLNGKKLKIFYTPTFKEILNQISTLDYVSNGGDFIFQNDCSSTTFKSYETVDEIRENAPKAFRGQYKIVQADEYNSFIKSNFGNLIQDSAVFGNEEFLSTYYTHYNNIGLSDPFDEKRIKHNQVLFGTSCNFNNVYCPIIPKTASFGQYYLNSNLKKLIKDSIDRQKCLTSNFIPIDPIYLKMFLGVGDISSQSDSYLKVIKTRNSGNEQTIRQEISKILSKTFDKTNLTLGPSLNVNDMLNEMLGIEGISEVYTYNTDNEYFKGIQFAYVDNLYDSYIIDYVNSFISFDLIYTYFLQDLNYIVNNIIFE